MAAGEPTRAAGAYSGLRVAIVHDWFQGFHGSERVVDVMASDVFPSAAAVDVFGFSAATELLPERLARRIVQTSRLSRLPAVRQRGHDPGRWRYLLPYMPTYFRRLDLDSYDIVVSSSHACAVQAHPRGEGLHLCYCYTPMRYAWMQGLERDRVQGLRGAALRASSAWLRRSDLRAAQRVHGYATLSSAVRDRIERFYGREATVIAPPVDVGDFEAGGSSREPGHFLWVHRMVPYKEPALVLEAFRDSPYRLTMVGVGPLEREIRASAPPNIEIHGWMPRERLVELFSRASAFVHVGEEDFGISMVEALAAGLPVLGLDRGGAIDIVRDGIDGVLVSGPTVEAVRSAADRVAEASWDRDALVARAREFSRERFVSRFTDFVAESLAQQGA